MAEITSPALVLRTGPAVLAAAGYRHWPNGVAHLSVLAAEPERGRGLARVVASAAVSQTLDEGLLPQWRARRPASRRVARALGFHGLGWQASIRLLPVHSPSQAMSPPQRR
jgi:RimJ/RimL family protein N-acetyltransferase